MTTEDEQKRDEDKDKPYPRRRLSPDYHGWPQVQETPGGPWVPDTSVEPPSSPAAPAAPKTQPKKRRIDLTDQPTVETPVVKPPQKGPKTPPSGGR